MAFPTLIRNVREPEVRTMSLGHNVEVSLVRLQALARQAPQIASSCPFGERTFRAGAREDSILALAATIGAALPLDYRAYLELCDGVVAMDVHHGYRSASRDACDTDCEPSQVRGAIAHAMSGCCRAFGSAWARLTRPSGVSVPN